MNKQKPGIEWTHVFGPGTGFTWSPVTGCAAACQWEMPGGDVARCYAGELAGKMPKHYPQGFNHITLHWDRLEEPVKMRQPERAGIFIGSMTDLLGSTVSQHMISSVLTVCRQTPQHVYMLLTKNAPRLLKIADLIPDNVWVGVSMPPSFMFGKPLTPYQQERYVRTAQHVLSQLDVPVRWMSFEPLSFDVAPLLKNGWPLQWAVIGAASVFHRPKGRTYEQPANQWVSNLETLLAQWGAPVFYKSNLARKPRRMEFPEVWRQGKLL